MKANIIVRQTTEADYSAVYDLIKTAFETAGHKDGTEQDYAVDLRNGMGYLPELDLVAEVDGETRRAYHVYQDVCNFAGW